MEREINLELILRQLEGNSTPDKERVFKNWLETKTNREYFDHIEKIWNTPDNPLPQPDLDQAWCIVKNKAGIKEQDPENVPPIQLRDSPTKIIPMIFRSRIFQVAAVFLFVIFLPYLIWTFTDSPKINEIIVANAQQKNIRLSDGTQIILDAGTTLRYPEQFAEKNREVYLNGEGYFKVTADPSRPFIVNANDAIITVLGTEFNIRAWKQNERVTVAVVQGKVGLRTTKKEGPGAEVFIQKNQVSVVFKNENPSLPGFSDIKSHLSWRQKENYFQSAPLLEVLDQLERWYDIEFQLPDEQSAENLVTIFIENKPIEEILDVISLMNDFQYRQENRKIIFSLRK